MAAVSTAAVSMAAVTTAGLAVKLVTEHCGVGVELGAGTQNETLA